MSEREWETAAPWRIQARMRAYFEERKWLTTRFAGLALLVRGCQVGGRDAKVKDIFPELED